MCFMHIPDIVYILPSNTHSSVQTTSTLVTNFVPNTTENMTFTINNQLTSQVQRLVRERPTTYDNLYQIYGGMFVTRDSITLNIL